ncbi:MAG: hypothetical protein WAM82_09710 [Thermoanaerobaculia bacterium]
MDEPTLPLEPAVTGTAHPRASWKEDFKAMVRQGDDAFLDGAVIIPTRWDEDWEWRENPEQPGV